VSKSFNVINPVYHRDSSKFQTFVSEIEAKGGADGPEDIMGGLKIALNELSWRPDACKVNNCCHTYNACNYVCTTYVVTLLCCLYYS